MRKKPLTDKDGEVRDVTRADLKKFRPLREVDPGMAGAMATLKAKRRRGRPRAETTRQMISFRLPRDIIDGIKAGGKGYNRRVERVLKQALEEGKL